MCRARNRFRLAIFFCDGNAFFSVMLSWLLKNVALVFHYPADLNLFLRLNMVRGIRVKSKKELSERIYKYFDEVNADPVVFHWKYKMDDVDLAENVVVDLLPVIKSS